MARRRRPTGAGPLQWLVRVGVAWCLTGAASLPPAVAQEPSAPQPVSDAALRAAIDTLGHLDYDTRSAAARVVRRTPVTQAVPALRAAVAQHADGYVRYRALVLLTAFNDPQTADVMRDALTSPNDRLRTVGYSYFARHPDEAMTGALMTALDRELAEFVRPMLVRALVAHAQADEVQQALIREAGRGEDFFRSAVIEALGDGRAAYAVPALEAIARLDGPLQDDAALALGRIGEARALPVLADLQRTAPRARQPIVAAAICLIGVNCEAHERYAAETLRFADTVPGYQDLLRGAAGALGVLGVAGRSSAVDVLLAVGIPSRDPTRAPVALALATVALRATPVMLGVLASHPDPAAPLALVAEGFDMLEEDLEKERFFAFVRRSYWSAADGSPTRALMQTLIDRLDF